MVAVASYLWSPRTQLSLLTFGVYTLLVFTTASLVVSTGQTSSPFIAMWIGVAVFAGVFGLRGFLLIVASTAGYLAYSYFIERSNEGLVIGAIAGLVPLAASFIIWHTKSSKDTEHDKAYSELASELSQEANKSDTVLSAINDGVISVDKQGIVQLINPAAQRMLGWDKSDAVGLNYKSVVKLNDRADKPVTAAADPIEKVLATNQQVHSEDFSIQTEAGKKILLSLMVSPIGQPSTGAIMVLRDMTIEKAEEREQAEFISTASHEMRTPVASIEGYLGLVLNPATATIDEKTRDYIQKAQASAQHLGRLFQDLLDVSKAEDGRMTNNPGVINVIEFISEVAEGLRPKAAEKGLRFLYKPKPDDTSIVTRLVAPVYYVHVDMDHLREVVANLIENAIKYTPAGDVVIDVTGDEKQVTISVQDSGIGIPTEDIPHLFQKFYRVDNSDTREIGGTGLGLYLCRRLAEVMGGKVRVESTYKQGSTFYVDLPRIDSEEAERLMEVAKVADETTIMADPTQQQALQPTGEIQTAASIQPMQQAAPIQNAQPAPAPVQQVAPAPAPQPAPVQAPVPPAPVQPQPIQPLPPAPQPTAERPGLQIPIREPGNEPQA
jgi:PAS domain S-box-containing protein